MDLTAFLEFQVAETSPWEVLMESECSLSDEGIELVPSGTGFWIKNSINGASLGFIDMDPADVTEDTKFKVTYCVAIRDVVNPETGEVTAEKGDKRFRAKLSSTSEEEAEVEEVTVKKVIRK